MRKQMKTLLITIELIILTAFAAYLTSPTRVLAQVTPKMTIEPSTYQAQKISESFDVTIKLYDIEATDKMVAAQFRVNYDASLLEFLSVTEGPFLKQFGNAVAEPFTYFVSFAEDDAIYGTHVLVGIILVPNGTGSWTNFPEGNGTLATITFKATYRPTEPATATCTLALNDTMVMDQDLQEIDHTTTDATYEALPIPHPSLNVEPSTYTASIIGERFTVDVNIQDVDRDARLTAAMFRVNYDTSLLEVLSVTEGPFLKQFGNAVAEPFTYFVSFVEDDVFYGTHVLVGILLVPNGTGSWTNFPEGNGTLATITFKATSQTGEPQPPVSSILPLNDTQLIDDIQNDITHTLVDGYYEMTPLTFNYEPSIPLAGQPVIFTGPEADHTVTYLWDFGDGTTLNVTESTAGHIYAVPGGYNVTLTCITDNLTSSVSKPITTWPFKPAIETTIDVGSIHFRGEITEFNILTTNYGEAVTATKVEAFLYHNSALHTDLTSRVQAVDTGYYTITYNIPSDAGTGAYTLLVKAEYYNAKGTSMKTFQISQTLTDWGNSITEIEDDIATIQTDLNVIKLNLTAINATLISIEGNIATINSTIGTLQTDLRNINATITGIITNSKNELIAEIDSALGTIQTDLSNINAEIIEVESALEDIRGTATTTLYVALILSAIAIILAAIILLILWKR